MKLIVDRHQGLWRIKVVEGDSEIRALEADEAEALLYMRMAMVEMTVREEASVSEGRSEVVMVSCEAAGCDWLGPIEQATKYREGRGTGHSETIIYGPCHAQVAAEREIEDLGAAMIRHSTPRS
jgi:hypothetical protein